MNPLRHPRLWVRLVCVVALGFGLWLLLVPRIVMYLVDDGGAPYDVHTKYAWGRGTSDQVFVLPADLLSDNPPPAGQGGAGPLVTSVRLNCGLVFTSGDHEATSPGGPAACAEAERPPLIGGLALTVAGIAGLVLARWLPSDRGSGAPEVSG